MHLHGQHTNACMHLHILNMHESEHASVLRCTLFLKKTLIGIELRLGVGNRSCRVKVGGADQTEIPLKF